MNDIELDSKKVVIIGASSDIGFALAKNWIEKGWNIFGTYRTYSNEVLWLKENIDHVIECDLMSIKDIKNVSSEVEKLFKPWDILLFGPGLQEPIGSFKDIQIDDWVDSFNVNFINQIRLLHLLIANRNSTSENIPKVIFFAGGGVNNAPVGYSAYTVAKIAMVKMVEILAEEIKNIRFTIIGPGWVKTKIHDSILNRKNELDLNYQRVLKKFQKDDFVPMNLVIDCCNKILEEQSDIYSGRNISVEFDLWGSVSLRELLKHDANMYKLRRCGNDLLVREKLDDGKK
jgi:NAD(P)-dependent dehydrogenase (short-subunit alcohol dehydrogenase family)